MIKARGKERVNDRVRWTGLENRYRERDKKEMKRA
jgi:hypothetical protein